MYVSSAHSITVLPSGPSRVTEYLALIAERGAAVRRATVDVRTAENAEAVTAVEEIVKADIVVVNVREVVRRRRDYSLTPRTHAQPIYPESPWVDQSQLEAIVHAESVLGVWYQVTLFPTPILPITTTRAGD